MFQGEFNKLDVSAVFSRLDAFVFSGLSSCFRGSAVEISPSYHLFNSVIKGFLSVLSRVELPVLRRFLLI